MSESKSLSQKLLQVQKEIGVAFRGGENKHFGSSYADLNEVLAVAKSVLNSQGIFIAQSPGANEHGKYLETSLIDGDSGHQIQGRVFFSGNEDNMQKIGAAITYARRFGLKSLLAMEDTDDDGETAVGRGDRSASPAAKPAAKPKGDDPARKAEMAKPTSNKSEEIPTSKEPAGKSPRKVVDQKISLTSKVLIDSKRASLDELQALVLQSYGVSTKEQLNDEQAAALLHTLEEKLNA